jgi:hypothetical protein
VNEGVILVVGVIEGVLDGVNEGVTLIDDVIVGVIEGVTLSDVETD